MTSKDEQEVLEFLDSLPETNSTVGSNDKEIFDFLDEIDNDAKPSKEGTAVEEKHISEEVPLSESKESKLQSGQSELDLESKLKAPVESTQREKSADVQTAQTETGTETPAPVSTFSSWWSTATNTLQSTAQSLTSAPLEDNIRFAFKELGITGIKDEISNSQKEELLKLNLGDVRKSLGDKIGQFNQFGDFTKLGDLSKEQLKIIGDKIGVENLTENLGEGLNIGMDMVSNVLEKINTRDEILEIVFVHDMNVEISNSFKDIIKNTFEDVMSEQVEGRIQVKIVETAPSGSQEDLNWNLFSGKGTDVEKLSKANIDAEIKLRSNSNLQTHEPIESTADGNSHKAAKSFIYINLIPWTCAKDINKPLDSIKMDESLSSHSSNSFTFLCSLIDISHDITLTSHSQPMPLKWAQWNQNIYNEKELNDLEFIDPKEWVSKWIMGSLVGVVGTVAQSYIIRRMGY
ncbi:Mtc1 protein [Martiniozyma asiatica (nom. inval.)]|nr:Mtc1 protein [Martiniozyma asiatica]